VIGEQRAHFPGLGEVALPRYDRAALAPGVPIDGPALIEDEWSTTLVYPGHRCAADRPGNLVLETSASLRGH
jgi:N-methylhydantoinase A/oxoprolinase/acetone carboxylase beta subunit